MATLVTVVRIFVSSPSDVAAERQGLVRAVERINRLAHVRDRFVLRPFLYEEIPPAAGYDAQAVVDRACSIESCHVVVCVLWSRMGTPFVHPITRERYVSGTEYEFRTAYAACRASGLPCVLMYRKTKEVSAAVADSGQGQLELIREFFAKFEGENPEFRGLYCEFCRNEEFEDRVLEHLLEYLERMPPLDVPTVALPSFVEEDRRLDAALPPDVQVSDTVELLTKVCVRESGGLRAELPEDRECRDSPCASDTRDKFLSVAFERPPDSQKLLPLETAVDVISPDFDVLERTRHVELRYGVDSPTLVFPLVPRRPKPNAYVQVRLRSRSLHADYWVENCTLSCRICVRHGPVLSRILSLFSNRVTSRPEEQRKDASQTDAHPSAESTVSHSYDIALRVEGEQGQEPCLLYEAHTPLGVHGRTTFYFTISHDQRQLVVPILRRQHGRPWEEIDQLQLHLSKADFTSPVEYLEVAVILTESGQLGLEVSFWDGRRFFHDLTPLMTDHPLPKHE